MISTNYVFPRIIKASEEKALIWDQTYWELFSLYLAYFTDLNAIQKKIIVYDESSVQPKGMDSFFGFERKSYLKKIFKYIISRCKCRVNTTKLSRKHGRQFIHDNIQ